MLALAYSPPLSNEIYHSSLYLVCVTLIMILNRNFGILNMCHILIGYVKWYLLCDSKFITLKHRMEKCLMSLVLES